jgi:hypothetical protein
MDTLRMCSGEVCHQLNLFSWGDSLLSQARLLKCVHGRLTPEGDFGTILVFHFHFIPLKYSRRFKRVQITLRFAGDAEVLDIAPIGHLSLHPVTKIFEHTTSADASVSSTIVGHAGVKVESKQSHEEIRQTTLSGAIRDGKTVQWACSENPYDKAGAPTELRAVVWLKKGAAHTKFSATLGLEFSVDVASLPQKIWDSILGRIPNNIPVTFERDETPTNPEINSNNLENVHRGAVECHHHKGCVRYERRAYHIFVANNARNHQ